MHCQSISLTVLLACSTQAARAQSDLGLAQAEARGLRLEGEERELQNSAKRLQWEADLRLLQEELARSEERARAAAETGEVQAAPARERALTEQLQAESRAKAAVADASALRVELEGERLRAQLAERRLAEAQESQAERLSQEKEGAEKARNWAEAAEAAALDALKARDDALYKAELAEAEARVLAERIESGSAGGTHGPGGTDGELLRQLQKEVTVMTGEVREARLLKGRVQSADLLQEKLRAADARVARLEESLKEAEAGQEQVASLQLEIEGWRKCLAQVPDVEKPEDVAGQMLRLQERSLAAAERRGQLEAEVVGLRAELAAAGSALRAEQAGSLTPSKGADALVLSLQQENRRSSAEVESLKRVIDSYEKEIEAILEGRAEQGGSGAAGGSGARAREFRYQEAEQALAAAKARAETIQGHLAQAVEEGNTRASDLQRCRVEVGELEARLAATEADLERTGKENGLLNQRLGAGRFDPATTKVLHFTRNPEAAAREEAVANKISALESENAALKGAVARLEEASAEGGRAGAGSGAPAQPGEASLVAVKEAELTILRRKLSSQEKMASRLKQAFQERVKTFRGACVALFGYQVEMSASRQVEGTAFTLTPAGALGDDAEAAGSQLVFTYRDKGPAELVPNAFSAGMQREVDAYLGRFHSVPAFTANLTMDLFQRHTSAGG